MALIVTKVLFMSAAFRAGIRKGDAIVAFDGYEYQDALDFAYYDGQSDFGVTFMRCSHRHEVRIHKHPEQPMGIEYEQEDMHIRHCTNKCVFCFVEQCPKGMRETLYVKDDDYRMSFACGSYVTLSNLRDEDISRILRLGLSPLYISVHAYDPVVKQRLCANPNSTKVFDYMRTFAAHNISMHTQIVMVEGMNDGAVLQETLQKLYEMIPYVQSVAVVPVGLTEHRQGLYPLHPVSRQCARDTIDAVEKMRERCLAEHGTRWVWCSDEMYILADYPIPQYETYEDFVQIENGVGMVSTFLHEVDEALQEKPTLRGQYTLVTGESFAPTLRGICEKLQAQNELELQVVAIQNNWFGKTVTVSGLLTGADIVEQLRQVGYHRHVVLPDNTLKEFETVLLDGMSVEEMERQLDCRILISQSGTDFIQILQQGDTDAL